MKTLRIETKGGGVFILKECTAFGMDAIMHKKDGIMQVMKIQDGDKVTEVK